MSWQVSVLAAVAPESGSPSAEPQWDGRPFTAPSFSFDRSRKALPDSLVRGTKCWTLLKS